MNYNQVQTNNSIQMNFCNCLIGIGKMRALKSKLLLIIPSFAIAISEFDEFDTNWRSWGGSAGRSTKPEEGSETLRETPGAIYNFKRFCNPRTNKKWRNTSRAFSIFLAPFETNSIQRDFWDSQWDSWDSQWDSWNFCDFQGFFGFLGIF